MVSKPEFHWADYMIFALTLVISSGVGIFYAWKGRKVTNPSGETTSSGGNETEEYFMGGRDMHWAPVSLSLMTTFISGLALLGVPTDVYQKGVLIWIYQLMGVPALLICAFLFLPMFYKIKPISIYEYFELRFQSRLLRQIASLLFLLTSLFYMAVVMYSPAVALSGVTGVPTWPFILVVGFVCTVYTTIGGLKAVVWTDTLQAGFMYAGILALIIKGTMNAGGIGEVFAVAQREGRLKPATFIDPDPTQYFNLWIAIFGGIAFWISLFGLNQMSVQRYCSLPSLRQAYYVVLFTIPVFIIMMSLCNYLGLVMLANFWDGELPLETGKNESKDQIVIYFVVKTLGSIPGLSGLFLASLFSSTLSTVAGGINSMAAVSWEDFGKHTSRMRDWPVAKTARFNKSLVGFYGVCAIGLAFAAEPMGGIITAAISMQGALAGPLVGLFFLGILIPRANKFGSAIAVIASMIITLWINVGSIVDKPYSFTLGYTNRSSCNGSIPAGSKYDLSSENCSVVPDRFKGWTGDPAAFILYRISDFSFALMGMLLVFGIGIIASYLFAWTQPSTTMERLRRQCSPYTLFPSKPPPPLDTIHSIDLKMDPISSDKILPRSPGVKSDSRKKRSKVHHERKEEK